MVRIAYVYIDVIFVFYGYIDLFICLFTMFYFLPTFYCKAGCLSMHVFYIFVYVLVSNI